MNIHFDSHLTILIAIMIVCGSFGGFLNYLHSFDVIEDERKSVAAKYKYIFLGVAAAFLVPAFLKMIASDLIHSKGEFDNDGYLIFAGFCLIAAIFSRRFIHSIGERILEAAQKAETLSKENKQQLENTKLELTSTQERIEDVKLAVDLSNVDENALLLENEDPTALLVGLVDSYTTRTNVSDYAERVKVKAEMARRMGDLIIRYDLPRMELLQKHPKEGMYLALSYSVQLRPDSSGSSLLDELTKLATQMYTKGTILTGYKTLCRAGFIQKDQVSQIRIAIEKFRPGADSSLLKNLQDTLDLLKFIEQG